MPDPVNVSPVAVNAGDYRTAIGDGPDAPATVTTAESAPVTFTVAEVSATVTTAVDIETVTSVNA